MLEDTLKAKGMSMSNERNGDSKPMCGMTTKRAISGELTAFFRRNGCVRRHDAERYAREGCMQYKKGEEIRLVANDIEEQERILRLLKRAGFKAGRPFRKGPQRAQSCVPLYGREQVARFLKMVEKTENCPPAGAGEVGSPSV